MLTETKPGTAMKTAGDVAPAGLRIRKHTTEAMQQLALSEFQPTDQDAPDLPPTECPTCHRDDFSTRGGMKSHHKQAHGVKLDRAEYEFKCQNCGETDWKDNLWEINRAENNFCDRDCKTEFYQTEYECGTCGTSGTRREHAVNRANVSYCSRRCADLARRERIGIECDHCGDTREKRPSEIKKGGDGVYCGPKCAVRGREKKVEVVCSACGETLPRHPYKLEMNEQHFCDWTCKSIGQREDNTSKSVSTVLRKALSELYWPDAASNYRESVSESCGLCGEQAADRHHHVHHIVPLLAGGVNEDWNYMVLCGSCHRYAESYTKDKIELPISDIVKRET
jgi:5-methylcytosine-specific restriction endonuclease McrA